MKIKGAYDCSYCHGDTDHACTACDPECDCIEIANGEADDYYPEKVEDDEEK